MVIRNAKKNIAISFKLRQYRDLQHIYNTVTGFSQRFLRQFCCSNLENLREHMKYNLNILIFRTFNGSPHLISSQLCLDLYLIQVVRNLWVHYSDPLLFQIPLVQKGHEDFQAPSIGAFRITQKYKFLSFKLNFSYILMKIGCITKVFKLV